MRPRQRLWGRLPLSHLVVVVIGSATLFLAVGLVAPGAFSDAMGHAMTGMEGMTDVMGGLVRAAFEEAVQKALVIAVVVAALAAIVVSIAGPGTIP